MEPLSDRGFIDPHLVGFGQASIATRFKDGTTIEDLATLIRDGGIDPTDVPPIRLFQHDGRRVHARQPTALGLSRRGRCRSVSHGLGRGEEASTMKAHDAGSGGNGARQTSLVAPLADMAETIESPGQMVAFIDALRHDLATRPNDWENGTLDRDLEALAAWTNDTDGRALNQSDSLHLEPSWRLFAHMLLAAKIYE